MDEYSQSHPFNRSPLNAHLSPTMPLCSCSRVSVAYAELTSLIDRLRDRQDAAVSSPGRSIDLP